MGFRPMPNDSNSLSTLIWYRGTGKDDYKYWVDTLQRFLEGELSQLVIIIIEFAFHYNANYQIFRYIIFMYSVCIYK